VQMVSELGSATGNARGRQLRREGIEVPRCTVERLRGDLGVAAATARRKKPRTAAPAPAARPSDLLQRGSAGSRVRPPVDRRYHFGTAGGFVSTASVTDLFPAESSAGRSRIRYACVQAGSIFVTTPRGVTYVIPDNWVPRIADNGQGIVFQEPGAQGNADMIRIMEPTARYPKGYAVVYNSQGQPVDNLGSPGKPARPPA
jgi:hypothetical protein